MKKAIATFVALAFLAPISLAGARDANRDETMRLWKETQRVEQKKVEAGKAEAIKVEAAKVQPTKGAPASRGFAGSN